MTNATRVTVATFGALAGLAGIEHGIGEMLQGSVAPDGILILSWPTSEFVRILGGEPAMTLIPNLLAAGTLTLVLSLVFAGWAVLLAHRKHGGLGLIGLATVMLLVGAGFGPPLLGIIMGMAATQINAPHTGWRGHGPVSIGMFLARLWPWAYGAAVIAWLSLMPGLPLLDKAVGANGPISDAVVYTVIGCAFGFLLITTVTGLAHDSQPHSVPLSRAIAGPVP
jgi:hypothetical protein